MFVKQFFFKAWRKNDKAIALNARIRVVSIYPAKNFYPFSDPKVYRRSKSWTFCTKTLFHFYGVAILSEDHATKGESQITKNSGLSVVVARSPGVFRLCLDCMGIPMLESGILHWLRIDCLASAPNGSAA